MLSHDALGQDFNNFYRIYPDAQYFVGKGKCWLNQSPSLQGQIWELGSFQAAILPVYGTLIIYE